MNKLISLVFLLASSSSLPIVLGDDNDIANNNNNVVATPPVSSPSSIATRPRLRKRTKANQIIAEKESLRDDSIPDVSLYILLDLYVLIYMFMCCNCKYRYQHIKHT